MKLYTPQVQLFRETVLDGPDEYYLHAVTFCGQTNLREGGYSLHSEDGNEKNALKIELFIREDPELPRMNSLTPVAHTISLGALPFEGEGRIEAQVVLQTAGDTRDVDGKVTPKGANTTSTTAADEVDRPIDEY
ncbi:MAG: hypothetical protein H6559_00300 [Lewinellaceae bacterium]|nr:hypothetical protein [Lewinellaceae bacterium]